MHLINFHRNPNTKILCILFTAWIVVACAKSTTRLVVIQGGVLVNEELKTSKEAVEESLIKLKANVVSICIKNDAPHSTAYDIQDLLRSNNIKYTVINDCET